MGLLVSVIATAAILIPTERHIDFSGWPGEALAANVKIDVRVTAMDGTVYETTVTLGPGATVTQARNCFWRWLESNECRGRAVEKGLIVLEGTKKSAIRSIEFTSKDWKPDVRIVPVVSPDKK